MLLWYNKTMRHFLAAALVLTLPFAVAAGDGDSPLDPSRVQWTRLEFVAKKLFLTARTEVALERLPAAEAEAAWIESEEGEGLRPASAEVVKVTIGSRVLGREDRITLWHDPRDLTAFERFKERYGKKAYRKNSRFVSGGVFVFRQAPIDGSEREKPFAEWTKVEKSFLEHPAGLGCGVVTEASALFYLVSAAELGAGESRRVCVLSKKRVFPVKVEAGELERLEVSYEVRRPGEEAKRRTGTIDVRRITMRPVAEEDQEELKLLGLEGEVTLFLEEGSGVPVRLEGRLSGAGHVTVRLTAVELGSPAPYRPLGGTEGGDR